MLDVYDSKLNQYMMDAYPLGIGGSIEGQTTVVAAQNVCVMLDDRSQAHTVGSNQIENVFKNVLKGW